MFRLVNEHFIRKVFLKYNFTWFNIPRIVSVEISGCNLECRYNSSAGNEYDKVTYNSSTFHDVHWQLNGRKTNVSKRHLLCLLQICLTNPIGTAAATKILYAACNASKINKIIATRLQVQWCTCNTSSHNTDYHSRQGIWSRIIPPYSQLHLYFPQNCFEYRPSLIVNNFREVLGKIFYYTLCLTTLSKEAIPHHTIQ